LECPNKAFPSTNFLPLSRGKANLEPSNFFTITGVPLARSNKNRTLIVNTVPGTYLDGLNLFARMPLNIKRIIYQATLTKTCLAELLVDRLSVNKVQKYRLSVNTVA
jgi:hypothetical protein